VAQRSGLLRAAAALHHLRGDYASALSCYLARPGAAGLFAYAERALADGGDGSRGGGVGLSAAARARFGEALQRHVAALIELDSEATASLLVRRLPEQQLAVLRALEARPELQFAFLRAAFAAQERARLAALRSGAAALGAASPVHAAALARLDDGAGGPAARRQQQSSSSQKQQQQLDRPEVVDLYIRLLCRFAPPEVLPFLQGGGTQSYDVRAAITHCAAAGVADAEAYLHERLGDLTAALRLYSREVTARCDAFEGAVRSGAAPAFALPPQLAGALGRVGGGGGARGLGPRAAALALVAWLQRQLGLPSTLEASPAPATAAGVFALAPAQQQPRQPLQQQQQQQDASPATLTAAQRRKASVTSQKANRQEAAAPDAAAAGGDDGPTAEEAAALAASYQIRGDRHLAWILALSPRARMHGAACAAAAPHRTDEPVPPEAAAAWRAMAAAVAFCRRSSRDMASRPAATRTAAAASSGGGAADEGAAQEAWFAVLDAYVSRLRRLKLQRDQSGSGRERERAAPGADRGGRRRGPPPGRSPDTELQCALLGLEAALAPSGLDASTHQSDAGLAPALEAAAAALVRRALRDAYTALIDEVISAMADHVPLLDIVARILQQHGQEAFGEFRPTLLGLFGAYAYERAIMGAASSLVTKDAFQQVARARALRAVAQRAAAAAAAAGSDGGDGGGDADGGVMGGGAGGGAVVNCAVQTAHRLGVLGRSVAFAEPRGVVGGGGDAAAAASPSERDLLVGMLLGGGHCLGLQLRPPPPDGAAAADGARLGAFRAAAQQAAALGDRFVGGCDLALEIAAIQEQLGLGTYHGGALSPAAAGAPGAGAGGAAAAGGVEHSSFDLDDMLSWTQANA
jgi:hypothetical protein